MRKLIQWCNHERKDTTKEGCWRRRQSRQGEDRPHLGQMVQNVIDVVLVVAALVVLIKMFKTLSQAGRVTLRKVKELRPKLSNEERERERMEAKAKEELEQQRAMKRDKKEKIQHDEAIRREMK